MSREEFIKWRDKYVYEPYGKNLFKDLKVFLKWLSERFNQPIFKEYADLLKWKGKKTTKMYVEEEEAITIEKIRKAIDVILKGKWKKAKLNDDFLKLRAITAIVLGCSTGLRPWELYRLEEKQIKEGIEKRYFILPKAYTKTPFERLIPINKETRWLLKNLFEIWIKHKKKLHLTGKIFSRDSITEVINKKTSGIETDNLRDFEVSYALNKLKVPGFLEALICGHDTEAYKTRIENYIKGKVSKEEIRDDWLKYWNDVNILTERQRKEVERLISGLRK